MFKFLGILLVLLQFQSFTAAAASVSAKHYTWKSILIAGDHSIPNFDNGRLKLGEIFNDLGLPYEDQIHLTSEANLVTNEVPLADANNVVSAFKSLNVGSENACLIHMTSHGAHGQGFYLSQAGIIPPRTLAELVDTACGEQPTIVLISACYSGQFVSSLEGPNRIVLTAASSERPSFGCSADYEYTFWDHCLIDNIPVSQTWNEVAENVKTCIEKREAELGAESSQPQSSIGENMQNLEVTFK